MSDLQPAQLSTVLENPGLWICYFPDRPDQIIPVVSVNGKIYAMRVDQELRLDGWNPETKFKGPLAPDKPCLILS